MTVGQDQLPHHTIGCCCCSAYKNKGVQTLLDGVTDYLPSPLDVTNTALDVNKDQAPLSLASTAQVAFQFKLALLAYAKFMLVCLPYTQMLGRLC